MTRSPLVPAFIEGLDHSEGTAVIDLPTDLEHKVGLVDVYKVGAIHDKVMYVNDGSFSLDVTDVEGIDVNKGRIGFWINIKNINGHSLNLFNVYLYAATGANSLIITVYTDIVITAGYDISYTWFDSSTSFPIDIQWSFIEYSYDTTAGIYSLYINGIRVAHVTDGSTNEFTDSSTLRITARNNPADFWWENVFITNDPDKDLYSLRTLTEYNDDTDIVFYWRGVGGGEVRSAPIFEDPIDYVNGTTGELWPWPLENSLVDDAPSSLSYPTTILNSTNTYQVYFPTIPNNIEDIGELGGYDIPAYDMNSGRFGLWIKISDAISDVDDYFAITNMGGDFESIDMVGLYFSADTTSPYLSVIYGAFMLLDEIKVRFTSSEWNFIEIGWNAAVGTLSVYINGEESSFAITPRSLPDAIQVLMIPYIQSTGTIQFCNVMISDNPRRNLYLLRDLTENPRIGLAIDSIIPVNRAKIIWYSNGCDIVIENGGTSVSVDLKTIGITTYEPTISATGDATVQIDLKDIDLQTFNPTLIASSSIDEIVDLKTINIVTHNPGIIIINQDDIWINIDKKDFTIDTFNPTIYLENSKTVSVDLKTFDITTFNCTLNNVLITVDLETRNITKFNPTVTAESVYLHVVEPTTPASDEMVNIGDITVIIPFDMALVTYANSIEVNGTPVDPSYDDITTSLYFDYTVLGDDIMTITVLKDAIYAADGVQLETDYEFTFYGEITSTSEFYVWMTCDNDSSTFIFSDINDYIVNDDYVLWIDQGAATVMSTDPKMIGNGSIIP